MACLCIYPCPQSSTLLSCSIFQSNTTCQHLVASLNFAYELLRRSSPQGAPYGVNWMPKWKMEGAHTYCSPRNPTPTSEHPFQKGAGHQAPAGAQYDPESVPQPPFPCAVHRLTSSVNPCTPTPICQPGRNPSASATVGTRSPVHLPMGS